MNFRDAMSAPVEEAIVPAAEPVVINADTPVASDAAPDAPLQTEQPAQIDSVTTVTEPLADGTTPPLADTPAEPAIFVQPNINSGEPVSQQASPVIPAEPVATNPYAYALEDKDAQLILDAWKTGQLASIVNMKSQDYTAMSDDAVLKLEMQQKFTGLDPAKRDQLIDGKLNKLYQITGDEDADSITLLEKEHDANMARQRLQQAAAEIKLPQAPAQLSKEQVLADIQQQEAARVESFKELVNQDLGFMHFDTNRVLNYGSGDDIYRMELPKDLNIKLEMITNSGNILPIFTDSNGNFDHTKYAKTIAYARNMEAIEKALIDHGQTLGHMRGFKAEMKNAVKPAEAPVSQHASTPITNRRGLNYRVIS